MTLRVDGERLIAHARRLIALNDEVWGAMSAASYAGEVRFGVPTDIVGSFIPPILKRFDTIEVVGPPKRVYSSFAKGYETLPVRIPG